ncbi:MULTISPECIES: hypothetical protein [Klebsiella]|uniref:hypothetical protein n=1 Tax=Klebsiella TaxID=570 RepID=UPI00191EC39B|nr:MULTISPECIES: hypothetical protein [Klebsiella]MBL0793011.1 hypothetical protein [Klebsiella michiganensis]MBX4828234.1 hypothetical protein [Klebsiella grimontii]MDU6583096.1 hypothetical protein [Klebsiella michiganensis]MDV1904636.1 hypothetical protein [Klebsiella pasteurii]MDV1910772.1 hypothetical protein [Klebsiella pasteurii]
MQGRQYSVTCYQPILEKQLLNKWQGPPTTKKPAPAVFNNPNGEKEMQNSSIMALALALCNVEQGQAVKVPAMAGSNFHLAIYKTLHLCDFEPFF